MATPKKIRERKVAAGGRRREPRNVSLTCAVALKAIVDNGGPLHAIDLIAELDKAGLHWSSESFYMSIRRWDASGIVSTRMVTSRGHEAGDQGARLEEVVHITPKGRRRLVRFLEAARGLFDDEGGG